MGNVFYYVKKNKQGEIVEKKIGNPKSKALHAKNGFHPMAEEDAEKPVQETQPYGDNTVNDGGQDVDQEVDPGADVDNEPTEEETTTED